MVLHSCEKYNLRKGNNLAEDKPDVILMSEVGGKPSILLMKMVVITNMVVHCGYHRYYNLDLSHQLAAMSLGVPLAISVLTCFTLYIFTRPTLSPAI